MRVLLIEDDSATAQSIELMLKSESFNVYTTDLGEEGVDLGKLYDYDIILLDLNLPDMSGYEVLRTLRLSKVKTPILILSGMAGIEDKVRGLGFGADDYMTKPFHKDELVARIHAIVRRSKGHAQSVIATGDLIVNLDAKTVEVGGQRVHLTGKEYQMLELLSLRKGTTLTKEMFLNHLYGGMDEPELKIIDVFICKLRRSLTPPPVARISSKRCGAAAMCCANRKISAKSPKAVHTEYVARLRAPFSFYAKPIPHRPRSTYSRLRAWPAPHPPLGNALSCEASPDHEPTDRAASIRRGCG
jgi:two-component system cell cycle response regulator CtrA